MVVKSDYYTRSKSSVRPGRHGSLGHPQSLEFLKDFDGGGYSQPVAPCGSPRAVENTDHDYYSDEHFSEIDEYDGSESDGRTYTVRPFLEMWHH